MADFYGSIVGTPEKDAKGFPGTSTRHKGGNQHVIVRDTIELPAGFAQNDRIYLGDVDPDTVIDPTASVIYFDDLGTGITMDVGTDGAENALVSAQDVATAAGSCGVYKSVDVANYWKPIWQVLGLSAKPAKRIPLYAKLEGGDPGVGTVTWQIVGLPR